MKILIDIYHIPQFNFFKNTILNLQKNEVDLCCIRRGRLVEIIKNDCPGYNLSVIGDYKYNKGKLSMLFRIIIPRFFKLFKLIRNKKYDLILTAHYQANLAARINRIPNIAFIDDPRKIAFDIDKISTNELYIPCFEKDIAKTVKFNALKEWAYLSPNVYSPDESVLNDYSLNPKEYIFIREVDTKTSNYLHQEEDLLLSLADQFKKFDKKIVLSLEKKQNKQKYPTSWIILEEPLKDIHSILYYSKLIISTGDSMAREGGMLGVPSVYCGDRIMPANQVLIEKGILTKVLPEELIDFCDKFLKEDISNTFQEDFRNNLNSEWDDVNNLIRRKIIQYTN